MFKVNNESTGTASVMLFWFFLLLTLTYFTPFSIVSISDSEQVNVSWVDNSKDYSLDYIAILTLCN